MRVTPFAMPSSNLLKCHVHIAHYTHIQQYAVIFVDISNWFFQFFMYIRLQIQTHYLFLYLFMFRLQIKKSSSSSSSTANKQPTNERLNEWTSEKPIQPLTIFHRICENRSNRNFSSVHNFYVFSVILLNRTDSVQLDSIEGSNVYGKCIHRTRTHTCTGQAFSADIDTIFSLHRFQPLHGAAFATNTKSLTCVLECLLWNWPCSWS